MSIAALALMSALTTGPAVQSDAPRVETRSEVRIVTAGGPDGPGRLDADNDGVVTREEFSAPLASAFDRMDADHDGRLNAEELRAGHGGGPGDHVMMMRDGPGGPGGHGPMIFHGGPGGPGSDVRVFTFRHGGPEGSPEGAPPPPGGPGERRVEIRRFGGPGGGDMDTDNDGKVSEEEFLAPMREAFQSMDADHDGSLEEGEAPHGPPPPPPPAD